MNRSFRLAASVTIAWLAPTLAAHAQPQQPQPQPQPQQPQPQQPQQPPQLPQQPRPAVNGPRLVPQVGVRPSPFMQIPGVAGVRPAMAVPALPPRRGPARRRRPPAPPPPPPGVELSVSPVPNHDRHLYFVELRATTWSRAEVLADRRLLRFDVVPAGGGRPLACAFPGAPRFRSAVDGARVLGEGGQPSWREWIDVREYCWGRALAALERGGRLEPRFGFARARRGEWVVRRGAEPDAPKASLLTGPPLEVTAAPIPATTDAPVTVTMRAADVATDDRLTFTLTVRASSRSVRVYHRADLYWFVVDGPRGRVECGPERIGLVPIRDFYRMISQRGGVSATIDVRFACQDVFRDAGIYEVTPRVDLPYDGSRFELEAVTGTFLGNPVPVRIRVGDRRFAPHPPETLPPARPRAGSGLTPTPPTGGGSREPS